MLTLARARSAREFSAIFQASCYASGNGGFLTMHGVCMKERLSSLWGGVTGQIRYTLNELQ
jgi:hypothetical protein